MKTNICFCQMPYIGQKSNLIKSVATKTNECQTDNFNIHNTRKK